jgi:aryl-alcohol dehydrogenase-like predicted oxidoreductase
MSDTFILGGDLVIHRLGFGAMHVTGPGIWGEPKNRKEAIQLLRRAVELGVNFIDTADSYGPEVSENILAGALYPYPKDLVIATKGGFVRPSSSQWTPLGRPEYLTQCIEMSLRRLRMDRIDLYQLHCIDPLVPLEESLGALHLAQKQGKIRHIGLSNFSVLELERAQKIVPFVSVQNLYNLNHRSSEDVLNYCEKHRMAFIPWYPIGSGEMARSGGKLDRLAKMKKVTTAQLAIAWLLKRSPVMIPIPGTSSLSHLEENMAAASIDLSEEEVAEMV